MLSRHFLSMGASGLCVACVLAVTGCADISSSAVGAGDGRASCGAPCVLVGLPVGVWCPWTVLRSLLPR